MALQGPTAPGVTGRKPQCRVESGVSGKHGLSACSREEQEVKASQEGSTAIWGPELSRTEGVPGSTEWFLLVSSLGHSACGHQLLATCKKNRGPSFLELKVKEMRPLRGQCTSSQRRLLRASAKLALRVKGQQVVLTPLGDVLDEQSRVKALTRKFYTLIEN